MDARVNFVEIDLLRRRADACESRAAAVRLPHSGLSRRRSGTPLCSFPYTSPIPPISIPLLPGDPEPDST